jgi:hypothetical protein
MKKLISIAFLLLSTVIYAQSNDPGVLIHFKPEKCKNKISSSFRDFGKNYEKGEVFEKNTTSLGLYLEPDKIFIVDFVSGGTRKYYIIDTNGINEYMEVNVEIDFSKNNTIETLRYSLQGDMFIIR